MENEVRISSFGSLRFDLPDVAACPTISDRVNYRMTRQKKALIVEAHSNAMRIISS